MPDGSFKYVDVESAGVDERHDTKATGVSQNVLLKAQKLSCDTIILLAMFGVVAPPTKFRNARF